MSGAVVEDGLAALRKMFSIKAAMIRIAE